MQLLEALQSFVKFCALETYSVESFVEPYWLELRFLLAGISTESLTYCHNLMIIRYAYCYYRHSKATDSNFVMSLRAPIVFFFGTASFSFPTHTAHRQLGFPGTQ